MGDAINDKLRYVVNATGEGHLSILHGGVALYGDSGDAGNHHVWWIKKRLSVNTEGTEGRNDTVQ